MAKAFILSDADIEALDAVLERTPLENAALSDEQRRTVEDVRRFFTYHVRVWISRVTK